jgi:hypothetical protein
MTRGGKREGAGAPKQAPVDAKRRNILLTDDEYNKVREFLKEMRRKKDGNHNTDIT